MKVSNKSVKHLKFKSGINKNIRKSLTGLDFSVHCRNTFKRSAGCCADCNNPSAVFLSFIYELCGFFGDFIMLAVHFMLCNIVNLNRSECTESHMKCNIRNLYTFSLDSVHKLGCKVKPCRRSCRRTEFMAVNRLIAFLVFKLGSNIRGKRHLTDFVKSGKEILFAIKINYSVAVILNFNNSCTQNAVAE